MTESHPRVNLFYVNGRKVVSLVGHYAEGTQCACTTFGLPRRQDCFQNMKDTGEWRRLDMCSFRPG